MGAGGTASVHHLFEQQVREWRDLLHRSLTRCERGEQLRLAVALSLALQINATVKRSLGFTVNPHLFRHIAAHTYLGLHPGGYEVMRRVLGHKRMETTSKYYAGLETLNATRHFDEVILKLRDDTKRGKKR